MLPTSERNPIVFRLLFVFSYFFYAFFPSFEFVFSIIQHIIPKSYTDEENAPLLLLLLLSTLLACMKSESLWGWVFVYPCVRSWDWLRQKNWSWPFIRDSDQYQYLSDFAWWPALRSAIVTCMDKVMHTILYVFFICIQSEQQQKVDIRSFFLSLK